MSLGNPIVGGLSLFSQLDDLLGQFIHLVVDIDVVHAAYHVELVSTVSRVVLLWVSAVFGGLWPAASVAHWLDASNCGLMGVLTYGLIDCRCLVQGVNLVLCDHWPAPSVPSLSQHLFARADSLVVPKVPWSILEESRGHFIIIWVEQHSPLRVVFEVWVRTCLQRICVTCQRISLEVDLALHLLHVVDCLTSAQTREGSATSTGSWLLLVSWHGEFLIWIHGLFFFTAVTVWLLKDVLGRVHFLNVSHWGSSAWLLVLNQGDKVVVLLDGQLVNIVPLWRI